MLGIHKMPQLAVSADVFIHMKAARQGNHSVIHILPTTRGCYFEDKKLQPWDKVNFSIRLTVLNGHSVIHILPGNVPGEKRDLSGMSHAGIPFSVFTVRLF